MAKMGYIFLQTLAILVLLFVLLAGPVLLASPAQVFYDDAITPTSAITSTTQIRGLPTQSPQTFSAQPTSGLEPKK